MKCSSKWDTSIFGKWLPAQHHKNIIGVVDQFCKIYKTFKLFLSLRVNNALQPLIAASAVRIVDNN